MLTLITKVDFPVLLKIEEVVLPRKNEEKIVNTSHSNNTEDMVREESEKEKEKTSLILMPGLEESSDGNAEQRYADDNCQTVSHGVWSWIDWWSWNARS